VELYADYGPDQLTYVTAAVLGFGYLAGGDTAQARTLLDTALTSAAADPTGSQGEELVLYQRALLRYTDGDATAARADLEAALAGHEDFYEATSLLAMILADGCTPERDLAGALALAGQASALRPDDAKGWQRLAGLRLRTGDLPGALAAAQRAQTLSPADPAVATLLAQVAQAANRPAEAATAAQSAEALLAQATSSDDLSAALWFDLGDLRLSLRQWDAAAAAYRQGLAQQPDNARGQAGLGRVLAKQGQTGAAEAHYRTWSAAAPQTMTPHLYLALLLYEQGRIAEALGENDLPGAEAAFRQALALEAGNGQIELSLGGTLFLAGRFEEAVALLQSAVTHQPTLMRAHYALAQSYRALGDAVQAQAAFARVAALAQPGDPPSLELAVALAATGQPTAAAEIYRALLAEQESPELHAYLADLYESTGQTAAAVAELRAALALDPQNQLTLLALGNLLVSLGDHAEAAEVLERYVALADNATIRTMLAHLYEGLGQPGVAAAHLQRAARLEPDNPDFPRLLAELAIDQGHLEQAERYLDDAMQLQPDDGALHATRSDLAYKRCNLDRAVLERERAVTLDPENAINRGVLASLYSGQGRTAAATPLIAELQNASDADFFAHLMAGAFLAMGDDWRDAEAELRVAVAISGTPPLLLALGHGLLGDLYLQQGNAPEAQASFDGALAANPAYVPALAGLGDLALEAGDLELAQRRYAAAAEALAAYGSVYGSDQARLLAIHLAARRSLAAPEGAAALAEAEQLARTLLANTPDWPEGHFALGLVLATAGRNAEAEAEFGTAIACDAMMAQRQMQAVALLKRLQLLVQ
jgi:tetratricopeptide (TPR) repeat protein